MFMRLPVLLLAAIFPVLLLAQEPPVRQQPFAIQVVDRATGRGVPLVRLRTTHEAVWVTDSAGWVAFDEPGLLGRDVFFFVESDGYEFPADGFGYRGIRLTGTPGGEARIEVDRTMIAERLYRVTGAGIYRDSVLLGRDVPLAEPLLNARVAGQDSVQNAFYKGTLYWFWGDTGRPEYPLGNFATSGATSLLPEQGGLDPAIGVNLRYFTDQTGFAKAMVNVPEDGLKWIDGLMVLPDAEGNERLVAHCERLRNLGTPLGRSLIVYDDETDTFVTLCAFDKTTTLYPAGRPFRHTESGTEYFYFPSPFPIVRVPAEWEAIQDPARYESFTCLEPGATYDKENPAIERGADGEPVWGWKRATQQLGATQQRELIDNGHLAPDQATIDVHDAATGGRVLLWSGTVAWNAYRQRWILIANEMWGKPSNLGEIWYAESERPEGPWRRAVKIATHASHSFYNPAHHPFFDQDGGRVIYFEGTYADTFASNAHPTPRYNYNQIMYRLDLADPRLHLDD
ncbi:MAG: hypothetical protein PWP23_1555 [Candidatus Sumerlaeota bacterium]|nr:hypothetical protein [Candidatus Sumerlaeota bacterium]